jgi:hypothetical protein
MEDKERQLFGGIAKRLTDPDLRNAFSVAAEGLSSIVLDKELKTISKCIKKANELVSTPNSIDNDFVGISNTKKILKEHNLDHIPNPFVFTDNPQPLLRSLLKTIEVGNSETGEWKTYRSPKAINNGDPLSVFHWFLYDGVGRMTAIHLGISNDNKDQEREGDWISCALIEAVVKLAEEEDIEAREVVGNMLNIGFIAKGWLLTNQLVERAQETQKTS